MKIDFQQPIKNVDGSNATDPQFVIKDGKQVISSEPLLTLGRVCIGALNFVNPHNPGELIPETMYKRGKLISQIQSEKILELTPEQIVELKSLITKAYYPPYTLMQCVDMLEQKQ